MQYNISINQKAVIDNSCFKDLDLTDLSLFDFIYHFFNCNIPYKISFRYNDKEYVEIRHQLIEREMPLLKFGCRKTFISRMNKLVNAGLISRYENNSKENRSGYCRGENFYKMVFSGLEKKEQPVTEELHGCNYKVTGGVTEELHNHSDKDNIDIKQHSKERIDKSIAKKGFDFKQALLDLGIEENIVNDWLLVRKQKKATNTETAFKRIKSEIDLSGISANECITLAIERCWMGFKAEWIKNIKSSYNNHKKSLSSQSTIVPLHPKLRIIDDDGKLSDGTYLKNGGRFYFSISNGKSCSIPPSAEPMPSGDSVFEYDYKLGWYECE